MLPLVSIVPFLLNVFLLLRYKHDKYLITLFSILLLFTYSISFGIYVDYKGPSYDSALNAYFDTALFVFVLFWVSLSVFFFLGLKLKPSNTISVFYTYQNRYKTPNIVVFCFLIYILVFQIDRTFSLSYEVKIKPLYEYSFIFIALLLSNSHSKKFDYLIYCISFLLCIQDAYYGGRATSLQVCLVVMLLRFSKYLNLKKISIAVFSGLLLFSLISAYRYSYNFNFDPIVIFNNLKSNLFIQDTAVYAYFASITQCYSIHFTPDTVRVESFFSFILSVFSGSESIIHDILGLDKNLTDVTNYASNYHYNVGGGVFPFYFFFWFGYIGVIVGALLLSRIIILLNNKNTNASRLLLVCVIASAPRWYLYSPMALFRGALFLTIILILLYRLYNCFVKIMK